MLRLRLLGEGEVPEAGSVSSGRAAARAAVALCAASLLASCATQGGGRAGEAAAARAAAYPAARFVVVSDVHVYAPPVYEPPSPRAAAEAGGRPWASLSLALFREAVSRAIALKPDFVLIPGDLTKDGELSSHEAVVGELDRLAASGVRAYVVPGNHDVENPRAQTYEGGELVALPSPSASRFAELYGGYGYAGAISRDRDSLSYVARLAPGLRLLAIDPFRRPPRPDPWNPEPAREIGAGTMAWIRAQLAEAEGAGDRVIAMSHLSVVEHFEGQARFFPSTLAREWRSLAELLASRGVELAFTGHFHIQDVTLESFPGGGRLYDVVTGSLASYPTPYRLVELKPREGGTAPLGAADIAGTAPGGLSPGASPVCAADIETRYLADFAPPPGGGEPPSSPAAPSRRALESWMKSVLELKLKSAFVPSSEAEALASRFARAYVALVAGDESPAPGDDELPEARSLAGRAASRFVGPLLKSLWRDLAPADNDLEISL